ncbi:alpha/beta hydrolase [Diaminobutyricibacter tongyongensis]|uniref:Alpha/beta hydrolase n=1 Tax=Leifsonia tongyongensis TaxID=1268043 RepID=A0A6L9XZV6_9MICO|nr:alpha/beta hydrolase [Diaminobutyricibacter tongyongensis]NEN06921.1 alpha/beta hydrolase [Diaminobutyricibacter tongyongensis]
MSRVSFAQTPDGQRIAYERTAGEHPVLLVHGFATTGALTWEATGWVRALAEAGRGAIVVDLRGHGRSSGPHDPDAYSPAIFARDLVAVLDAEGLEAVDVVGYSMGSYVSLALAQGYRDRIRRQVVGGIGTTEQFARWGVDAVRTALLQPSDPEADLSDSPIAPLLTSLRQAPGLDREALAACVEGMAAHPLDLSSPVPTMLVVGEADPVTEGREEAARMLDAELVVIPRRNHVTTLSARAFKQAALPFLDAASSS